MAVNPPMIIDTNKGWVKPNHNQPAVLGYD